MRRVVLVLLAVLACGRAQIYEPGTPRPRPGGGSSGGGRAGGGGFAGGFGGGGGLGGGGFVGAGGGIAGGAGGGGPGGGGTAGGGIGGFDGGSTCPTVFGPTCPFTAPPLSLSCLPGVRTLSHDTSLGRDRYVLAFRQPVNHDVPNGPTFEQQVWLYHRAADKPMVLLTTGYEVYETLDELGLRFDVNELYVEHRYFGSSYPDGGQFDFRTLDIRQASLDLHRIRVAFASLYPKPWVSTGGSKGGMTMVYYRRFFPCDVAGTVAYVAPLMGAEHDPVFPAFLAQVGGTARTDCRNRLANLQRQLLERRAVLEPQVRVDGGFTILGSPERAYEDGVIGLGFGFWQYLDPDDPSIGCSALPAGTLSDLQLRPWADAFVGGADESLVPLAAFFYQAATQLGYRQQYTAPFAAVLQYPDAGWARGYVPKTISVPPFDPAPMREVQAWVADAGERIIFVYGELDPWTAKPYALGRSVDTLRVFGPGRNHLTLLSDLGFNDEEASMQKIERWLGVRRTNLQQLVDPHTLVEPPDLRRPNTYAWPRLRASPRQWSSDRPSTSPPLER